VDLELEGVGLVDGEGFFDTLALTLALAVAVLVALAETAAMLTMLTPPLVMRNCGVGLQGWGEGGR
jgi:hypothetical protein